MARWIRRFRPAPARARRCMRWRFIPPTRLTPGKVLIGGAFTNINNFAVGGIARLNGDGTIDTNFDVNLNAGNTVRAIAIQTDGRVVFGGDFTNVNGVALNYLARLNPDGTLDSGVHDRLGRGRQRHGQRDRPAGRQPDRRGRPVHAGQRRHPQPHHPAHAGRHSGSDHQFWRRCQRRGQCAWSSSPPDQMLVIGGSFTTYNDQPPTTSRASTAGR